MNTLIQILDRTTDFFTRKGIPDPRLDAQYLLAHELGMSRMDLYLNYDRPLTEPELDRLRTLVARRAKREPLQHILGDTSFRGHRILCDSRALIPRPETEELVELALLHIQKNPVQRVLDIGTGTGAIALSIALENPDVQVVALDISQDALDLAVENATLHHVHDKIEFKKSNLLSDLDPLERYDLIVSNPPYIPQKMLSDLQPEVQKDPMLALNGGEDGLDLVRKLLQQIPAVLNPEGLALMELGEQQIELLQQEWDQGLWPSWQRFVGQNDLQGVERFMSSAIAKDC